MKRTSLRLFALAAFALLSLSSSSCSEEKTLFESVDLNSMSTKSTAGSTQPYKPSVKWNSYVRTYFFVWEFKTINYGVDPGASFKINDVLKDRIVCSDSRTPNSYQASAATMLFMPNYSFPTPAMPEPGIGKNKKSIGVAPAVEFVQKGAKVGSGDDKVVWTFNYLELSVPVRFRMDMPNGSHWSAGLGPYFSYALGGHFKITNAGETKKVKLFPDNGYKRLDAGLTIGAGYWFPSGLAIGADYDLGLTNIATSDGIKTRTRAFKLSAGYSLNKLLAMAKLDKRKK